MGTTWHVTYVDSGHLVREGEILAGIEARLEEVNASMSTYREDSEISRLNTAPLDTWVDVSLPFYTVLSTALEVGRSSGGAYDVTVGPLVNLWGFGPQSGPDKVPDPALIATLLQQVGQEKLRLDREGLRVKKLADLSLDFSSLAKGYAVDQVALWLEEQGITRYLVEVGGEMRAAGLSGRGDPWRIAIEQPEIDAHGVAAALELSDMAIATSGDYRNYFELAGQRYSHSIDPRTGFPVAHELVSVTVVHASAMVADAWATALIVLGPQRADEVAELHGLAVYFIQRDAGGYVHSQTAGFDQYLPTSG
jgi:thiamine biosynthesis lipoprotein